MYLKENNVTDVRVNVSSYLPDDVSDISNHDVQDSQVIWIFIDIFLFIVIVLGNILTILAIAWARRLRNIVSNYFIFNLAISDLLVGVTLPFHLAFYVSSALNHNELFCVSRFVIITIACGGSIYNLMVIAIDRYVAIVHPLSYNSYITRKRVLLIIIIAWICIMGVSSIPIYWNCFDPSQSCELETVLPRHYIVAIQMPSFFLSWIAMFLLYWKIWREAHMHTRRMNLSAVPNIAEKNDRKSVQVVMLILGCFSICWFPYFVVACMRTFGWKTDSMTIWYKSTFALAIANSGMNPFIYAWKNASLRKAFRNILRFKSPNNDLNSSFKMYLKRQRELKLQQTDTENSQHINFNNSTHERPSDHRSDHTKENKVETTTL